MKSEDNAETNPDDVHMHTLRYSTGGVLANKSAQTPSKPDQSPSLLTLQNPSDLPFIDEDERELDEAIRDATGLTQDQVVSSIQLGSTSSTPIGPAATLLISERSCSGIDTIHMSEKVIKRNYRDL